MNTQQRYIMIVLVACLLVGPGLAQDNTCPAIISDALEAVDALCNETGRNQVCYGNVMLTVEVQEGIEDAIFETPGDIVDVANIRSLALSPMDEAAGEWGVSLMKLQANLPNTLPGQNVTILLFGDVEIETAQPMVLLDVTVSAESTINVRARPGTNAPVVGGLPSNTTVTSHGRNADGDWLRVRLPNNGEIGWVFADLVSVTGDASLLNVVSADELVYSPMQAFYFQSGINDAPCVEAPKSGMLIQTPRGQGVVELLVNEVKISLGSTVYLQAVAGDALYVNLLNGQAVVEAFGERITAFAGTVVSVPLDANLAASGPPNLPAPYPAEFVETLPVSLLEYQPNLSEPLTQEEIDACRVTAVGDILVRKGPGTIYESAHYPLRDGAARVAQGQTTGTDNQTWWQISASFWVRDDEVILSGDCENVPVTEEVREEVRSEYFDPQEMVSSDGEGPCVVTAIEDVNVRSGPSTTAALQGALSASQGADAVMQLISTDGLIWWQLASGAWVRADLVDESGDCLGLASPEVVTVTLENQCGMGDNVFITGPSGIQLWVPGMSVTQVQLLPGTYDFVAKFSWCQVIEGEVYGVQVPPFNYFLACPPANWCN